MQFAPHKKGLQLNELLQSFLVAAIAVTLGIMVAKLGIGIAGAMIGLPLVIAYLVYIFKNPRIGVITVFHYSFIVNGLSRYLPPSVPYGLVVDAVFIITVIACVFTIKKEQAARINNPAFWLSFAWMMWIMFELFNPEATSKEAWFYAMRGIGLYPVLQIPLMLILMPDRKDLTFLFKLVLGWALIASLYAFKQHYIGIDSFEQKWLDDGGKVTHCIQGRMRIWSFYSDAGQFGAGMAHMAVFCIILALSPINTKKQKIGYWIAFAMVFWGYALSGSRGPLFVIIGGLFIYLLMIGNIKILVIGGLVGGLFFGLLKFTSVGSSNYQIQRMRSGLDPNDPSLLVRLENQKNLKTYLASRPIGAGIGTGGSWGDRFYKGRWLSTVQLDSWYVRIWVEMGVVGLTLHLLHLFICLGVGMYNITKIKDPHLRTQIIALAAGFFGIMFASYGNQILGQNPTAVVMYMSMVYFFICRNWVDKDGNILPEHDIDK
ncbi:MAG: O-antigen ligase family protein [Bacteroidia bacterium]|jgi:hypothetical protein